MLALLVLCSGCSDRVTDTDRPAELTLALELPKGASTAQVTSGTARFVSDLFPLDSTLQTELVISGGAYEGRLEDVPFGPGELTVNLFDESGLLMYRGSSRAVVIPGRINEVTVPLQGPPESIDNPIVYLHFDHDHGAIDSITFKLGSNRDLLSQDNNIELAQYGLGGIVGQESGTVLRRFDVGTNSAVVEYANESQYGGKIFNIRWGITIGLEIDIEYSIATGRQAGIGYSWLPGGDADQQRDSLIVYDGAGRLNAFLYTYPDQGADLFSGQALAVGMLDSEYDVVFGFRFESTRNLSCRQNGSADGPYTTLAPGNHTVSFAVKSRLGFVIWTVGRD